MIDSMDSYHMGLDDGLTKSRKIIANLLSAPVIDAVARELAETYGSILTRATAEHLIQTALKAAGAVRDENV